MADIYEEISRISRSETKAALCTVISTKGSTPRKTGSKMIVYEDGRIIGTIGGGGLEKNVIVDAMKLLEKGSPAVFKHDLLHQHGMCCGGIVEIFIEPIVKTKRLFIFGAGHTGQSLAKLALETGFDVYLIDDRKEYIDQCAIPGINKMNLQHLPACEALPFDKNAFIVITTYSHQIDRDILAYCVNKPWAYLGMIGSQRKVLMTKKMFIESHIGSQEELDKIHMPIGIDINAETPEEIAVSILAELIKVRNSIKEKNG